MVTLKNINKLLSKEHLMDESYEKTYKLLNHDNSISIDEIRRLYKGHWVYLVNVMFSEFNGILSGRPVVIGTRAFDGAKDGIYEKYDAGEYAPRADLNLLPNRGFISSLRFVGDTNE